MNTETNTTTPTIDEQMLLATKIDNEGNLVDENGNKIEQTTEDLEATPFDVSNTVH